MTIVSGTRKGGKKSPTGQWWVVNDRTQAAVYALRKGWIRLSETDPECQP